MSNPVNTWVMPIFWFMLKLLVLLFCTVWIRATLPRLRYDQLMDLGWKWLIEIAFLFVMVSGVFRVARDQNWPVWTYVVATVAALLLLVGLRLCVPRRGEYVEEIA